ncbi:MAG: HEAT repeat domain-containing protein, partial [Planctomycetota bacterium]
MRKGAALLGVLLAVSVQAEPDAGALLKSAAPEEREKGIAQLADTRTVAVAKQLMPLLSDPDWGVRMAAARALGPIEFEPARGLLFKTAIRGETRRLRTLAATLLRDHAPGFAAAKLKSMARKLTKEDR